MHKSKSGDTERDSTRRTQKGRYSALLENHIKMARDSARDLNTIETVKNLKEVKNFLHKIGKIDNFEEIYVDVGRVFVDEIIRKIKGVVAGREGTAVTETTRRYRDNTRKARDMSKTEQLLFEERGITAWISEDLSELLKNFLNFLTKSESLLDYKKKLLEQKETTLKAPFLTKTLLLEKNQKNIQQCLLVEYLLTKIFNLINAHFEKMHKLPMIHGKEREFVSHHREFELEVYTDLFLNLLPRSLSDYFTSQAILLYIKTAEKPYFLFAGYSLRLVNIALDFFGKMWNLRMIDDILDKFTEVFEKLDQHENCGEILQFRAEFLENMAGSRKRRELSTWYLGRERYLWMAAMDFKKATFYFREANATEKYRKTEERSSSIFQNFSRAKEDYMFSIRPLSSEETITNLYVDTEYEDELRSIIDLTDGGNYAVIGPRGSGKSTLVNRILKEYEEKEDFLTLRLEAPRRYDTLEFFQFFYLKLAKEVEQKISHQMPYILKIILTIEILLRKIFPFIILLFLLIFIGDILGFDISLADFYSWIVRGMSYVYNNSIVILIVWYMAIFSIIYTVSWKKSTDANKSFLLASTVVLILFLIGKETYLHSVRVLAEIGLFIFDFLLLSFLIAIIACAILFPYILIDFLSEDKSINLNRKISYFVLSIVPIVFVVLSYLQVGWANKVIRVDHASDIFLLVFLVASYSALMYKYAKKRDYPIFVFNIPSLLLLSVSGVGLLQNAVIDLLIGSSCLLLLIIGTVSLCTAFDSPRLMRYDPSRQTPFSISFVFLFLLSLIIYRSWDGNILEFIGLVTFICFSFLVIHKIFYLLERKNVVREKNRMKSEFILASAVFFLVLLGLMNEMSDSRISIHQNLFNYCRTYFPWMNSLFSVGTFAGSFEGYSFSFFTTEFLGLIVSVMAISAILLVHLTARKGSELWNRAKRIIGDLSYLTAVHEESSLGLSSIVPFAGKLKGITIQKREYTLPSISERIQNFIIESTETFNEGILIIIDEIDKMRSEDAVEFLNDLRGIISIKKAYFFLVSPSSFYNEFIKGIMAFDEKKSPDSAIDEIIELRLENGSNELEKLLKKRLSRRGINNFEEGAINAIAILSRGIPRDAVRHLNSVFREWITQGEKPNIAIEDVIQRIFVPQVLKLCESEGRSKQACDGVISCYSKLRENEDIKKVLEDKNSQEMRKLESMIRKLQEHDYSIF